ncbi:glycoside hydrolase family 2 TIM barrel-domain containing protein [Collinsella intestinalis]|uniref:glycoside hydrolase family 2 TIM barrel-domain containing protein n=1 Tax=Collinsella intestinalis TaxID=147207 RepID=UPI0025A31C1D|nr:glycoside hydrolase family 2 TIM barrel-domain containing protein [Collinsella intestinalis]MDM8163222.1 glycoside hydrolase family 2 TIM barrel-domain containing protein [Collinsella intestinalis]
MNTSSPTLAWLQDPEVFEVNRLPAHSDHTWYGAQRICTRTLDGSWRFAYTSSIDERSRNFWHEDADLSTFGTIQVPAHIELEGYGQIQYVNTQYPWDGVSSLRPPAIDTDRCAVGCYVRNFELDSAWEDMRVCISFQGVERAFFLWVNGCFVGYAEDSFTPSDFDLTDYLHPGINRLAVEVFQHSSASWLEDQDMFRFFGIFRPVVLYAKPRLHVEDIWLRAELDTDNITGILDPRITISSADDAETLASCIVRLRVTDANGTKLYEGAPGFTTVEQANSPWEDARTVELDCPLRLENIVPWSHEQPALYTVEVALVDFHSGCEVERATVRTGFRRVGIEDGVLRLNGQRLFFCGVNRHEWSAEHGRAIAHDDMIRAMETFKRNNINAVRTCHYPDQTPWYDLCDENGVYMIDEANLETHGSWQKLGAVDPAWNVPGSLAAWTPAVIDRARSMFERDKNHPAVLMWSCGNESYAGDAILAMSRFFHETDPSRPVHYEGVFQARGREGYDPAWEETSDVESRMYATPADIRHYLENSPKKPFILCEYMHDMGNSLGGMESYMRLGEEFEQYQGGFIWDYMDQALWRRDALGRRSLGYGGDFGERPSDYAFSGDGIVFADGTEKPAMQEVRYWYADASTRAAHDAACDAAEAESARAIAAQAATRRERAAEAPDLVIAQGDVNLGVTCGELSILFSWAEHGPVSLRVNGREWLWRAPRPALWRASTDNDRGCGFPARSAAWLAAEAFCRCTDQRVEELGPRRVVVAYRFAADVVPGAEIVLRYTVEAGTGMLVEALYTGVGGLPELPCFGVHLVTPAPVADVAWTGLSGETYPDRWRGGTFGRHHEEPHVPAYLVPQDCGCHVRTHELELSARDAGGHCWGKIAFVMEEEPFAFSALPASALELESAAHPEELPVTERTHLCLYGAMRGVGGIDSWGSDVEKPYRIDAAGTYRVAVRILG